jgi:pre-mRNA-splicing factor CWC26
MDEQLAGKGAETVYRDRKGRKLDMLNEFMRQQAIVEGAAVRVERAQVEWGKGTVQKQSAESSRKELEILAAEPFARAEDDPRMESLRRQEIRDGDPMAEYFASKQQSSSSSSSSSSSTGRGGGRPRKPLYQGPAPPSNRFNIPPGYRWDGVDRGNAWEAKILKGANKRKSIKDDAAAWSMADM